MKNFAISVIIPTYNRFEQLLRTIDSVMQSNIKNTEIIVIDNNSTDKRYLNLNNIFSNIKNVRIIRNSQNVGATRNYFIGYCNVTSPYVINASDQHPFQGDYLLKCLEIFEANEKVALIHHKPSNSYEREKFEYKIHNKGSDSIYNIFMLAGTIGGAAYRFKALDLLNFPLTFRSGRAIYPQVKVALEISQKYSVAIIKGCGIVINYNKNLSPKQKLINQKRSNDFGINERLEYALELLDLKKVQPICNSLSKKSLEIFCSFYKEDKLLALKFLDALSFGLNSKSCIFILLLLRNGYIYQAIYSFLKTILRDPKALFCYVFSIQFIFLKKFT